MLQLCQRDSGLVVSTRDTGTLTLTSITLREVDTVICNYCYLNVSFKWPLAAIDDTFLYILQVVGLLVVLKDCVKIRYAIKVFY